MKYAGILLCLIILAQPSCYLNNTDSGRVVFRFTSPAPPDVSKLHVAVFRDSGTDANLLQYQVVKPNSIVDLDVQAGDDRIFTVWAEGFGGTAIYYGTSAPMTVSSGESVEVSLKMNKFDDSSTSPVFNIDFTGTEVRWNFINGASRYEVRNGNGGVVYFDSPNMYSTPFGDSYAVRAYSSIFNLFSEPAILNW